MSRFPGWTEESIRRLQEKPTKELSDDKKKKNKYNAKKTDYGGKRFDSEFEASIAEQLDWRVKAGDIAGYETQVKIKLKVNNKHICNHYMDFVITHNDGSKEYLEAKGYATQLWKLKRRLFLALNPGIKYTVLYK